MNIEQAKAIPLADILDIIGFKPTKVKPSSSVYSSPLRNESTPSFHVNHSSNVWYDHGPGIGGKVIEFVCAYLESKGEGHTVSDSLRWLTNMFGDKRFVMPVSFAEPIKKDPQLVIKKTSQLQHRALINYINLRGLDSGIASNYLIEVRVQNKETNKEFFALGWPNEDGGHELRNKFFKGCAGPKTISFIRGKQPKPEGIHLFEGKMDFLSAITHRKVDCFEEDAIILNSLSCLKQAIPYIQNYGYKNLYSWMDNDKAGHKATQTIKEFCKTEPQLTHQAMNKIYAPYKDVNDWFTQQFQSPS